MAKFVDIHAHILKQYYGEVLEDVITRAKDTIIIINSVDIATSIEAIKIAKTHENIYASIGVHPSEVEKTAQSDLKILEELVESEKVIAIGETGLDLYWRKDNLEKQLMFFNFHINLSRKTGKPLIIHSRSAEKEVYDNLKDKEANFIMHCYSGEEHLLRKFLKLGGYFSFGGVISFKKAHNARKLVDLVPLDRILTETDSPYLSPEPVRGKKNEPFNIRYIVDIISKIKGVESEKTKNIIYSNLLFKFDLK